MTNHELSVNYFKGEVHWITPIKEINELQFIDKFKGADFYVMNFI